MSQEEEEEEEEEVPLFDLDLELLEETDAL